MQLLTIVAAIEEMETLELKRKPLDYTPSTFSLCQLSFAPASKCQEATKGLSY